MQFTGILYLSSFFVVAFSDFQENVDEAKVVCEALTSKDEPSFKIGSLSSPMKYEDVLKLVSWNMKHDLKSGKKEFLMPDVKWRRPILNEIFGIFKSGCPNDSVPHEFVNILKELVMVYYNSLEKLKDNTENWVNMLKVLKDCKSKGHVLPMSSHGLLADKLSLNSEEVKVLTPIERADSLPAMDLIIDNLWWIFSFSFGSCYSPAGYRSSWAPRYKKQFYEDFMVPFLQRWGNVGPVANFGVIFGNFDLTTILVNVRLCVTSTYTALGIADRQLVRPLKLGNPKRNLQNRKTGEAMQM